MTKFHTERIHFKTTKQIEFIDVTTSVEDIIARSGVREGNVIIFAPHTTLGIVLNNNEPLLIQDFMRLLYKLVPVDDQYAHDFYELRRGVKVSDGRSNGHSHCKTLLIGNSEMIPLQKGKLLISHTQSIFAVEFDGARTRDIVVQVNGN